MKTLPTVIPNAQVYKVGGYVRDKLLGISPHDCDYVVVGSTPKQMLKLGFIQVGKKFPVFLHPKTKEEFALARHDIKIGSGHKGFEFKIGPDVTIDEDLIRRDITINAIAEDINGNIIDPFGGIDDLKHKIIRHVSPAFAEDPLRVLRVARFKARFNFSIAPETIELMKHIVKQGELATLSNERIHGELHKALVTDNCYSFFEVLNQVGALELTFPIFKKLLSNPDSNQFIQCILKDISHITLHHKIKLQSPLRITSKIVKNSEYEFDQISVNLTCLTFFCNLAYKKFNLPPIELSQLTKTLGLNNNNLRLATITINHYPTIANIMFEPVTNIRKMIKRLATIQLKLQFFLLSEIIGSIEKQHPVIIKNIKVTNELIEEFNSIDRKSILQNIAEKDRASFIKKFELDFILQFLTKII